MSKVTQLGRMMWLGKQLYCTVIMVARGFPDSSVGKEFTCNAGDPGSIPGLGRSAREGKKLSISVF